MTAFCRTGTRTLTTLVVTKRVAGTKQYQLRLTTTGAPKYPETVKEKLGGIGAHPMKSLLNDHVTQAGAQTKPGTQTHPYAGVNVYVP
jgi:hypothetical protein